MRVELDLFSGQPNPHWDLTAPQRSELETTLAALQRRAVPAARTWGGLGYRGMVVHGQDFVIRVAFGTVVRAEGGHETVFDDPGRALEAWLASTGRGRIDERMVKAALDAIQRPGN